MSMETIIKAAELAAHHTLKGVLNSPSVSFNLLLMPRGIHVYWFSAHGGGGACLVEWERINDDLINTINSIADKIVNYVHQPDISSD